MEQQLMKWVIFFISFQGYLISSSFRAWKSNKRSSIGLTGSKALFSSKSTSSELDGNLISNSGSTATGVPSSAKLDSLANMSTMSSSQLSTYEGKKNINLINITDFYDFNTISVCTNIGSLTSFTLLHWPMLIFYSCAKYKKPSLTSYCAPPESKLQERLFAFIDRYVY